MGVGFLEVASINTGRIVKFKYQINNKFFFSVYMSSIILVFYLTSLPGIGLVHFQERA